MPYKHRSLISCLNMSFRHSCAHSLSPSCPARALGRQAAVCTKEAFCKKMKRNQRFLKGPTTRSGKHMTSLPWTGQHPEERHMMLESVRTGWGCVTRAISFPQNCLLVRTGQSQSRLPAPASQNWPHTLNSRRKKAACWGGEQHQQPSWHRSPCAAWLSTLGRGHEVQQTGGLC